MASQIIDLIWPVCLVAFVAITFAAWVKNALDELSYEKNVRNFHGEIIEKSEPIGPIDAGKDKK